MLSRKPIPEDLRGIDAALREARPELPEDRARFIAARARSRALASAGFNNPQKESFLRSRIAITIMLVLGFGFSSAGVGMAVNGVAQQDNSAADVQYGAPTTPESPTLGPVPGENEVGGAPTTPESPTLGPVPGENEVGGETDESPAPDVAGESDRGTNVPAAAGEEAAPAQESRQLAAAQGEDELPFTGFAAIPVLLMGLGLLSAGFILRRRA